MIATHATRRELLNLDKLSTYQSYVYNSTDSKSSIAIEVPIIENANGNCL